MTRTDDTDAKVLINEKRDYENTDMFGYWEIINNNKILLLFKLYAYKVWKL